MTVDGGVLTCEPCQPDSCGALGNFVLGVVEQPEADVEAEPGGGRVDDPSGDGDGGQCAHPGPCIGRGGAEQGTDEWHEQDDTDGAEDDADDGQALVEDDGAALPGGSRASRVRIIGPAPGLRRRVRSMCGNPRPTSSGSGRLRRAVRCGCLFRRCGRDRGRRCGRRRRGCAGGVR